MQKSKPVHRFEEDREKIRHFKHRAKRARYDLSRFEPAVREIMEVGKRRHKTEPRDVKGVFSTTQLVSQPF